MREQKNKDGKDDCCRINEDARAEIVKTAVTFLSFEVSYHVATGLLVMENDFSFTSYIHKDILMYRPGAL